MTFKVVYIVVCFSNYGEVQGVVPVERWFCSKCFMCDGYGVVEGLVCTLRWSYNRGVSHVVECAIEMFKEWSLGR